MKGLIVGLGITGLFVLQLLGLGTILSVYTGLGLGQAALALAGVESIIIIAVLFSVVHRAQKYAEGPQGVQGVQGVQGEQGEQGVPGRTGPQGATGAAGKDAHNTERNSE